MTIIYSNGAFNSPFYVVDILPQTNYTHLDLF